MTDDGAPTDDYDAEALGRASGRDQLAFMEDWFRRRYEDPANSTPYDSGEGGYIYIWGGPYEADEVLHTEFDAVVPEDVINSLASRLAAESSDWAPLDRSDDEFDDGLYEAISSNAVARQTLAEAVAVIRALLAIEIPPHLEAAYRRLLFANAITALETYLSDTFINRVLRDKALLQKYADSEPRFREKKVLYKDVAREAALFDAKVRGELLDIVWHHLDKVAGMYADVLGVRFRDVGAIGAAIQIRHDIVHRNGRQKVGELVDPSSDEIVALLNEITELAARIEIKLDFGIDEMPI